MLNRLRTNLLAAKLLEIVDSKQAWEAMSTSDFVELRGRFTPNPLRDAFQRMGRLLDLAEIAGGLETGPSAKATKKMVQGILKGLEVEGTRTYMVELSELADHKALCTLFVEYLRDPSDSELPHGEFWLLGKVARILSGSDTIDLLRGSSFSGLKEETLKGIISSFQ
jgi:hypothetical protein